MHQRLWQDMHSTVGATDDKVPLICVPATLPCAGVGISGREGMQAVMSSDFAIAQVPASSERRLQLGATTYTAR